MLARRFRPMLAAWMREALLQASRRLAERPAIRLPTFPRLCGIAGEAQGSDPRSPCRGVRDESVPAARRVLRCGARFLRRGACREDAQAWACGAALVAEHFREGAWPSASG